MCISVHAHNTPITSGEIKMLAIMFVWKLYCLIENDRRDVLTLQIFESMKRLTSQALMQHNVIII